jgi:hypothetical protein
MTEFDLARELGLIKKRSSKNFNNTILLNQRLVEHILSLKAEHEERQREIVYEYVLDDTPTPTNEKQEEKIVELTPIPNFVWQQSETADVGKGEVVLKMSEYKERKKKEKIDRLIANGEDIPNFLLVS